jgi:hypothetical protein
VTGEAITPYRIAWRLALRRLIWDLNPLSWSSRARLARLRDAHAGEKALILCNGPSLNAVDFEMVAASGVFTFGLNKINLLFPRTDFRPHAIVAVNPLVIEQNAAFYNETAIPLFLDRAGRHRVRPRQGVTFLHSCPVAGLFARDCRISINQGYTVTYVALQLAYHMGFRDVALTGCDHSFAAQGRPNEEVVSQSADPNHFDPNYFGAGTRWHLPDLAASEYHYAIARDTYADSGRRVVNCTEGGRLEVFERMELGAFLGGDQ